MIPTSYKNFIKSHWIWSFILLPIILIGYLIFQLFVPQSLESRPITITIPHNSSTRTILNILSQHDLIHSPLFMRIYLKITPKKHAFHFGKYQFNTTDTPRSVIQYLQNNQGDQDLIKITIPEGFNIEQIAQALQKADVIQAEPFLAYTRQLAKQELSKAFPFLNDYPFDTIEGYLYPDTYLFAYNTPPKIIIATMLREFQRNMITVWENRPKNKKTRLSFHQTLTLASILEKEAVIPTELSIIASVYQNRITKRMRLEADPTVVYALGKAHKRRVLYKDLRVNSPYNTYKFFGLPPTPIASPSKKAFTAAVNPAATPYFYFVANPTTHQHLFSRNYAEHRANINKARH